MTQESNMNNTKTPQRNIVLQIGIFMGFIPLTVLMALFVRGTFTGDFYTLYFVPFTAVPAFVVQMLGLLLNAKILAPVSKAAGRMIITTMLFVVFAVILIVRGVF